MHELGFIYSLTQAQKQSSVIARVAGSKASNLGSIQIYFFNLFFVEFIYLDDNYRKLEFQKNITPIPMYLCHTR